jgi:hypothetical protein
MDEGLSVRLDNHRTLWLTEISRKTFEDQDLNELESDGGLFVVLEDSAAGSFEVLAKAASIWAGAELIEILAAAFAVPKNMAFPVEHLSNTIRISEPL